MRQSTHTRKRAKLKGAGRIALHKHDVCETKHARTIPEYNKTCHELKGSPGKGTVQAGQCLQGKARHKIRKKAVLQPHCKSVKIMT